MGGLLNLPAPQLNRELLHLFHPPRVCEVGGPGSYDGPDGRRRNECGLLRRWAKIGNSSSGWLFRIPLALM